MFVLLLANPTARVLPGAMSSLNRLRPDPVTFLRATSDLEQKSIDPLHFASYAATTRPHATS